MIFNAKRLFFGIFLIWFGWIFINTILNNNLLSKTSPTLIIILSFTLIAICVKYLSTIKEQLKGLNNKRTAIVIAVSLALYLPLQIYIGMSLRVTPSWDFSFVFNHLKQWILTPELDRIEFTEYLSIWPNNRGITFYLYILYSIIKGIGIKLTGENFLQSGIIIHCVIMNITILTAALIPLRKGRHKAALAVLYALMFSAPLTLYLPVLYTDTFSMIFILLLIHILISLDKISNKYIKILLIVLFALISVFGMCVKITVLLFPLAYIFWKSLLMISKKSWHDLIIPVCMTVLIVVIYPIINNSIASFVLTGNETRFAIPYTHFIMMGLSEDGGYSEEAYYKTFAGQSKEEVREINLAEINNLMKNYKESGYIRFLTEKGVYTWGDGNYYALDKLSRSPEEPESTLHKILFVEGKMRRPAIILLSNVLNTALLFLIGCSFFKSFRNKGTDTTDVLRIAFFALFVFLMIWETRSRYLVNFYPIFVFLALDGLSYISEKAPEISKFARWIIGRKQKTELVS